MRRAAVEAAEMAPRMDVPVKDFVEAVLNLVPESLREDGRRMAAEMDLGTSKMADDMKQDGAIKKWRVLPRQGWKRKVGWGDRVEETKKWCNTADDEDWEDDPEEEIQNSVELETDIRSLSTALDGLYLTPDAAAKAEQAKADAAEALAQLPPRERVLATTELLENILVHLSPAGVLKSQAVCKTFKRCYENSFALRLKTFKSIRSVAAKVPAMLPPQQPGAPWEFDFAVNAMLVKGPLPLANTDARRLELQLPHGIVTLQFIAPVTLKEEFLKYERRDYTMLKVAFDYDEPLDVKRVGSWQHLHLTDPGLPVVVMVTRVRKQILAEMSTGVPFMAVIDLGPCTIGQAIEVATGADKLLRSNVVWKIPNGMSGLGEYGVGLSARRLMRAPMRWLRGSSTEIKRSLN